ncbi:tetratricopeptide repeat protein [Acrocarpospora sp. B8E8]|uniref:tetratricopeptide repeat protein n=1 Tax=Acrocarpospora sp. B8E8 TaxID=3153572 RepID=UPI00325D060B
MSEPTPDEIDPIECAQLLILGGHYRQAEDVLLTARRDAVADSEEDARCANGLGVVYKYLGRYDDARRAYEQARAVIEPADPAGPMMATLLHNLAGLAHSRGQSADGEADARRAVELRVALVGADHEDVAADLANLGVLLEAQGKFEEARACFERAVAIFERVRGRAHPEVAFNLGNLAAIAEARGRYEESQLLYDEALALQRDLLGSGHPETMRTLNNLAYLYRVSGRRAEAVAAYRTVVATLEPQVSADHPVLRAARAQLDREAV